MEDFLKAVANTVFPIAVAVYLLIRIEGKLDSLSVSINQLSTILSINLMAIRLLKKQQKKVSPHTYFVLQGRLYFFILLFSLTLNSVAHISAATL